MHEDNLLKERKQTHDIVVIAMHSFVLGYLAKSKNLSLKCSLSANVFAF